MRNEESGQSSYSLRKWRQSIEVLTTDHLRRRSSIIQYDHLNLMVFLPLSQ
jgi:hypothetical protein